jgi:lipopolysaccharide export LptBFGC system permease protein LptF
LIYTLYKYIFRELLRVFLLALVALTLILSLGSILQPIQQYGAGPRQIIIFTFYFLPITLTFVLPMAALFAGSLVYGRFTSDNELDACRASGISILNLVVPGLFLAAVVAISNLFLSFYVMPTFVQLAEKSLKADIKQMLFRGIEQKGYYTVPAASQYLIYADYVDKQNDTLFGVVLTKVDGQAIDEINTTESAKINIIPHEKSNEVQITTRNLYRISSKNAAKLESWVFTTEFGSLLADNIAFKKIDEMARIKDDLMRFDPVASIAYQTLTQLSAELIAHDIQNHISQVRDDNDQKPDEAESFYELTGGPNSVKFSLVPCTIEKMQLNLAGEITFMEFDTAGKNILHTFKCREAYLRIEGGWPEPKLAMDIRSATETQTGEIKMWHSVAGLNVPKNVEKTIKQLYNDKGSLNVQKLSSGLNLSKEFKPSEELISLQSSLARKILQTNTEIKAELHSRLVFGIGCIFMILIGISLGIIKKGGHLLSAFGASCVPAAILVVCIMSGKQLAENLGAQSVSGITIMWTGLAALVLLSMTLYYYLVKN